MPATSSARTKIGAAVALVLLAAAGPASATVRERSAPAKRTPTPLVQRLARSLVAHGAPGAVVVVRTSKGVRRGAAGLGQRQPKVAMRAINRFRVASITKPFVSAVVLQLVAEGKLSLGDSVERWLPGLVPNGGAITLRELLDHTSGMFNYTEDQTFGDAVVSQPSRTWQPRELVGYATSHGPLFPPGSSWSYSNTNYVLLGLVVETVTGTPLEQQLRERIIGPLGLPATSFPSEVGIAGPHAHGYIGTATLPLPRGTLLDVTDLLSPTHLWAAGALVSNGDDVTRFFSRLLGGKLLRPDLLTAMKTAAPRSTYGLGLERVPTGCGGQAFGHVGDFPGYRSVAYALPNGRRAAFVAVNIDATRVSWDELRTAARRALCDG
jgi:D-alanyl-D-alanine carboxypeptidase